LCTLEETFHHPQAETEHDVETDISPKIIALIKGTFISLIRTCIKIMTQINRLPEILNWFLFFPLSKILFSPVSYYVAQSSAGSWHLYVWK
jgi:hypothetical protein